MTGIWFCLLLLTISVWTNDTQSGNLYQIPFGPCSGSDEVKEPTLKLNEIRVNVTFISDALRAYGPSNCDYTVQYNFTTKDATNLKLSLNMNGTLLPVVDVCNRTTTPCTDGENKNYLMTFLFPAENTKHMTGNITFHSIFKRNDDKVSCSTNKYSAFNSSSCY